MVNAIKVIISFKCSVRCIEITTFLKLICTNFSETRSKKVSFQILHWH